MKTQLFFNVETLLSVWLKSTEDLWLMGLQPAKNIMIWPEFLTT